MKAVYLRFQCEHPNGDASYEIDVKSDRFGVLNYRWRFASSGTRVNYVHPTVQSQLPHTTDEALTVTSLARSIARRLGLYYTQVETIFAREIEK